MLVVVVLVNMFVPHVLSREKIFTIEARDISSLNMNTFYVFVGFLSGGTTSLAQAAERFLRHGIDFDEFLYLFIVEIFEH